MVLSWSVVAYPHLWLIFPCQHFAIYIHKYQDQTTIHPVTAIDINVSHQDFSHLTPTTIARQFVITLQETWSQAQSTQVHIMHHYRFLLNLVVKFKLNHDKVLLRRVLLSCHTPEYELVE